jgi:hypothetical protein
MRLCRPCIIRLANRKHIVANYSLVESSLRFSYPMNECAVIGLSVSISLPFMELSLNTIIAEHDSIF